MTVQEQRQTSWEKVVNSRFLAGVGVVALLLIGGFMIFSLAEAQVSGYTMASVNEVNALQQQINSLHHRVTTLEAQVRDLQNVPRPVAVAPVQPRIPNTGVAVAPARAVTTYPTIAPVMTNNAMVATPRVIIDQNGGTFTEGWDIYFTGRGFTPSEQVLITRNGIVVGHVTVDAGGGFASSGVFLPEGTHTFTFTGQSSSVSAVASVRGVNNVLNS